MKKIAIVGAGDLGQQIAHHVTQDNQFTVVGYFDDFLTRDEKNQDLPILGGLKDIFSTYQEKVFDEILMGIGYNHLPFRKKVYTELKNKVPFATFIHSSCILDNTSKVKEGVIIYPGCTIDQRAVINENTLINIDCSVAHDSTIGAHSFLAPRVAIAGFVSIGEECFLGINSTIIDNISVTKRSWVGAGAVVIKHITNSGLCVGNPGRIIKEYDSI